MANFTNINIIAEEIQFILNGGNVSTDSQLDVRVIKLAVSQAAAKLIGMEFNAKAKTFAGSISGTYLQVFEDVAVQYNGNRNKFFSELPYEYLNLDEDRGIHQISAMKDEDNVFIPVRNGMSSLLANTPQGRMEGKVSYFPEGLRNVIYRNDMDMLGIKTVLVKMIVGDTNMIIPKHLVADIIKLSMEVLRLIDKPQDKVTDSNKIV